MFGHSDASPRARGAAATPLARRHRSIRSSWRASRRAAGADVGARTTRDERSNATIRDGGDEVRRRGANDDARDDDRARRRRADGSSRGLREDDGARDGGATRDARGRVDARRIGGEGRAEAVEDDAREGRAAGTRANDDERGD